MKYLKVGTSQLSIDDLYMNAASSLASIVYVDILFHSANIEDFDTEITYHGDTISFYDRKQQGFPFEMPHVSPEMEVSYELFRIISPYCFTFSLKDNKLLSFDFLDALSSPYVYHSYDYNIDNIFSAQFFKDISYLAVHYSRDTLITLDSYKKL